MPIFDEDVNAYLQTAPARLDAAAASNATNAANTIKALQELGLGGAPVVDTRAALAKLTGGQTLTNAEKQALGMSVTPTPTTGNIGSPDVVVPKTDARPDINNRNIVPTEDPGAGYKWQWVSMAYANNKWGGEWRKVSTGTGGGGGNTGPTGSPGAAWIWNGTSWVKPAMPTDGKIYTWDDNKGWVTSNVNTGPTQTQVDSIAAISALLSSYGIGDLSDAITQAVVKGYSADTIKLIMQDPNSNDPLAVAFQKRFPANKARLAAGKAVLSASEYLAAERTYSQIFQSYGLGTMATRDYFNKFIEGDVSATEVSDRISLAVNRVQNASKDVRDALKTYYPMLNQSDIVGAMLNPAEGLPALQRKVQIAEIGGAGFAQNLNVSLGTAQDLASLGITRAQAQAGYGQIAQGLPTYEKLLEIRTGQDISTQEAQGMLEQNVFYKNTAEQERLRKIAEEEANRFAGKSGSAGSRAFSSQLRGSGLI